MPPPKFHKYFTTFTADALGRIPVTGVLKVAAFRKVHLEIIQWPHVDVKMTVVCNMGKLKNQILGQQVGQFHLHTEGGIHSFDVIGPDFSVVLMGAKKDQQVPIQAWVLLH